MSPMLVTARRTLSALRNRFSAALITAAFLSATAARFAFELESVDGSVLPLAAVWAGCISPFLPFVSAFFAMDVWSEERRTGNIDALLSIAVRERDLVIGKMLGVWLAQGLAVLLAAVVSMAVLAMLAPAGFRGLGLLPFIPAFAALAVQAALWTSLTVMVSAFFVHGAASAVVSLVLTAALPRGLWAAASCFLEVERPTFGEFPLDAQVIDAACGTLSSGIFAGYVFAIAAALFIASKVVSSLRFRGASGLRGRGSSALAGLLALLAAASLTLLALRLDVSLELPVKGGETLSQRSRYILSEASGRVSVSCFMPRSDPAFRGIAHLLREFKARADALGSFQLDISYVDPRWDIGTAAHLVANGSEEGTVTFARGSRKAQLLVADGIDERSVASAIRRVAMPSQRRDICWTCGHGELAFDNHGPWGMSDIARELRRDGYRNLRVELSADGAIPPDCALIVVAGAKQDFSRAELGRLTAYLKNGGRLLVLASPPGRAGVASLLPAWGIRPVVQPIAGAKTQTGSDVVISDFAEHPVTARLGDCRIILEKPLAFVSSAVADSVQGVDRLEFTALASAAQVGVAAAVERGAGAGKDIAVRPTRIVAIGDSSFVVNAQLASRANANGDFFLNAVSYLAGVEATNAGAPAGSVFVNFDRGLRRGYLLAAAGAAPLAVLLLLTAVVVRRRMRR